MNTAQLRAENSVSTGIKQILRQLLAKVKW